MTETTPTPKTIRTINFEVHANPEITLIHALALCVETLGKDCDIDQKRRATVWLAERHKGIHIMDQIMGPNYTHVRTR